MSRGANLHALAITLWRDADDPERVRQIADVLLGAVDALDADDRAAATGVPAEGAALIRVTPPPAPPPPLRPRSASAIAYCGRRADR